VTLANTLLESNASRTVRQRLHSCRLGSCMGGERRKQHPNVRGFYVIAPDGREFTWCELRAYLGLDLLLVPCRAQQRLAFLTVRELLFFRVFARPQSAQRSRARARGLYGRVLRRARPGRPALETGCAPLSIGMHWFATCCSGSRIRCSGAPVPSPVSRS
jgi:hypothetical protein